MAVLETRAWSVSWTWAVRAVRNLHWVRGSGARWHLEINVIRVRRIYRTSTTVQCEDYLYLWSILRIGEIPGQTLLAIRNIVRHIVTRTYFSHEDRNGFQLNAILVAIWSSWSSKSAASTLGMTAAVEDQTNSHRQGVKASVFEPLDLIGSSSRHTILGVILQLIQVVKDDRARGTTSLHRVCYSHSNLPGWREEWSCASLLANILGLYVWW